MVSTVTPEVMPARRAPDLAPQPHRHMHHSQKRRTGKLERHHRCHDLLCVCPITCSQSPQPRCPRCLRPLPTTQSDSVTPLCLPRHDRTSIMQRRTIRGKHVAERLRPQEDTIIQARSRSIDLLARRQFYTKLGLREAPHVSFELADSRRRRIQRRDVQPTMERPPGCDSLHITAPDRTGCSHTTPLDA